MPPDLAVFLLHIEKYVLLCLDERKKDKGEEDMTEKRSFSDNWSGLSDEQVLEAVQYLSAQYKDYEIKRIDKNTISIANVLLTKAKFQNKDVFVVNEKICTNGNIYNLLYSLFCDCEQEIETREILQKLKKKKARKASRRYWWNSNRVPFICFGSSVLVAFIMAGIVVYEVKREEEIDKKVEQYEKTLPNYQEYKEKVANYRDSLQNAKTK